MPDISIYVRTDPAECHRASTRGREREEDIGLLLEFLTGLHLLHEQVYGGVPAQPPVDPAKVIILNNDTHVEKAKRETSDHPLLATLFNGEEAPPSPTSSNQVQYRLI